MADIYSFHGCLNLLRGKWKIETLHLDEEKARIGESERAPPEVESSEPIPAHFPDCNRFAEVASTGLGVLTTLSEPLPDTALFREWREDYRAAKERDQPEIEEPEP